MPPLKNTFTGFSADKLKTDRKIDKENYAKLVSFNFGDFWARHKALHIYGVTGINQQL